MHRTIDLISLVMQFYIQGWQKKLCLDVVYAVFIKCMRHPVNNLIELISATFVDVEKYLSLITLDWLIFKFNVKYSNNGIQMCY